MMAQRSIDIDVDKCQMLAGVLGTSSYQETVDKALDMLLAQAGGAPNRHQFIAAMRAGHFAEVFDEKVTARSWW